MSRRQSRQWEGIAKVQWPVRWHGGNPQCLVYPETRDRMIHIPATEEVRKWMGGQPKVYAYVKVNAHNQLELGEKVTGLDW